MAQRVEILLLDDIDGSKADDTVRFGLDGQQYEIDLNAANATALRAVVEPYAEHARRTTAANGKRKTGSAASRALPKAMFRSASASSQSGQLDATRRAEIRAWAKTSGQFGDVPERGRLSSSIIAAYNAAHGLA